jgi:hypothetical protein
MPGLRRESWTGLGEDAVPVEVRPALAVRAVRRVLVG